jgi:hypothetical protein
MAQGSSEHLLLFWGSISLFGDFWYLQIYYMSHNFWYYNIFITKLKTENPELSAELLGGAGGGGGGVGVLTNFSRDFKTFGTTITYHLKLTSISATNTKQIWTIKNPSSKSCIIRLLFYRKTANYVQHLPPTNALWRELKDRKLDKKYYI